MKKLILLIFLTIVIFAGIRKVNLDVTLRRSIELAGAKALDSEPEQNSAKVELGRMLFFDKILSGNKDISCATCHHPGLQTSDSLALSIGVGGRGFGKKRVMGEGRERIPRNAPEVFNRGVKEWHTMFWDSRVSAGLRGGFDSPADEKLPDGLDNILAVQAMFPVTSPDEMRGDVGDLDIFGEENELALISGAMLPSIWYRLMQRLLAIPEYVRLFEAAYPDVSIKNLGFQHAANAIAAFEIEAFTLTDSPWDNYLRGNNKALSEKTKLGAILFYGKANCGTCHSGFLMTDQQHHNIGVPQLGPGKGNARPLDPGRYVETGDPADRFAFRTPPLRNVALTGPWMHNGAYSNLEDVIRHHLDPVYFLQDYNSEQLEAELRETIRSDGFTNTKIIASLDSLVIEPISLSDQEVAELVDFLNALTDSKIFELGSIVPDSVPSGLPVED